MPNGHICLFVLFYLPPIGRAFAVPNDNHSVAESIMFFNNLVAGPACNSDQEPILYVLGDFNMPGSDWETVIGTNCRESEFVEICADYNLMPLVLSPTHDRGNILDTILLSTSGYQTHLVSALKGCSNSDHHPIPARLCDYETICNFCEKTFSFNDCTAFAILFTPLLWFSILFLIFQILKQQTLSIRFSHLNLLKSTMKPLL